MKRISICSNVLLGLVFLFPAAAHCQHGAILTGMFKGIKNNGMVSVCSSKGVQDSVVIKDGAFRFDFPPQEQWELYFITLHGSPMPFAFPVFLDEKSRLHLVVSKTPDGYGYAFSGDKNAEEQEDFWKGYVGVSTAYQQLEKEIAASDTTDTQKTAQLKAALRRKEQQINNYPGNWVLNHKQVPFSAAAIFMFIHHNISLGRDTVAERYFDALLPEALENNYIAASLKSDFKWFSDKYATSPLGGKARAFSIKDTTGNAITLDGINAPYLLIDFWASWCGPCRADIPRVAGIYDKYKGRGLDVLSISMDENPEKWKEAVKEHKMAWLQGSDLKGGRDGIGFDYQVTGIPYYLLLDAKRNIVWRSTWEAYMDDLESKLQQIFGN
ncbi:AhpC/TSA family protein [Chitinophaga polysaccharea]|uniref:TlpA family protein disulfide reductase n=1 Tax=Chitinophaga TaxID=79328 RepID=UPI0014554D18|nr:MULTISPECIES: TlpA disulfide reductase family protein [Chitinophaga]NLR57069.1 AhpC/TSA family protein [Chitinophaga polysaccharea]NLU91806.1 AhpC/TSA family protein [Chitinophaga sp. Ak27]